LLEIIRALHGAADLVHALQEPKVSLPLPLCALALGDVHHDTAQLGRPILFDDDVYDVTQPDRPPIGGDHAILDIVLAVRRGRFTAARDGSVVIVGVNVARPKTRCQPLLQRIAQQPFGLFAHEPKVKRSGVGFPDDPADVGDELLVALFEHDTSHRSSCGSRSV
jgi:hypothetical protein